MFVFFFYKKKKKKKKKLILFIHIKIQINKSINNTSI